MFVNLEFGISLVSRKVIHHLSATLSSRPFLPVECLRPSHRIYIS